MTRAIFCNVAALAMLAAVTVPASAAMKPAALGSALASGGVIRVQAQGQGQQGQGQAQDQDEGQPQGQKGQQRKSSKKRGGNSQQGMMQKIKKNVPAEYQQYLGGAGGAGGMGGGGMGGMGGPQ